MGELLPWEFASTDEANTILIIGTVLMPMIIAAAMYIARPPSRQRLGSLILTLCWNGVWLLAGNELAVQLQWWTFESAGPQIGNVPVSLWLGWAFLWGPVAAQLPIRPAATVVLLATIDVVAMPLMDSAVTLGTNWLIGEAVLLLAVAYPGLLLGRWLGDEKHLTPFVILQVVMFAGILFWFIPHLSVQAAGQDLNLDVAPWAFGAVLASVGACSIPALVAIGDFSLNGGSPWPWDSTDRPVLSGPYRYTRSPVQASAFLILLTTAVIYWQWPIALGAVGAILYSALFSQLEEEDLSERFGPAWSRVVAGQSRWLPSWNPHPETDHAVVWINEGCASCSPLAEFLQGRRPTQLDFGWAHEHPEPLIRVRYERADGSTFDGVAAVGACLEHLNLGYAAIGWLLRAPVLWRAWQMIGDAVGFGPTEAVPATQSCLLYTSPSPRDKRQSRMPSSA